MAVEGLGSSFRCLYLRTKTVVSDNPHGTILVKSESVRYHGKVITFNSKRMCMTI